MNTSRPTPLLALPLKLALLCALSAGLLASAQAQTPDARRLNDSANISGEVVSGARTLKHRLRITFRQAPPQELVIDAASETVFANMQAAYAAYRNKDSASKDFAHVVSPSGWSLVIYWPEVVALQRWTDKP